MYTYPYSELMNRRDVHYIALSKELCRKIDQVKKSVLVYGQEKYSSRPDFVHKAVIEQLHKEKTNTKEVLA